MSRKNSGDVDSGTGDVALVVDRLMTHIAACLDAAIIHLFKEHGVRLHDIQIEHQDRGGGQESKFITISERGKYRRVFECRVTWPNRLPDMWDESMKFTISVEPIWLDEKMRPGVSHS